MIKKCLTYCLLLAASCLTAQSYNTALGVRLGNDFGLSLQQRILKNSTIEGIGMTNFRNGDLYLIGLWEEHRPLLTKRINYYYGGGLHKIWLNDAPNQKDALGISIIGGIEFTVLGVVLSVDALPMLNMEGGRSWINYSSAFSARYILIKPKRKTFL